MTDKFICPPVFHVPAHKRELAKHIEQTAEQKRAAKAQQAFISAPILGKQNEH